MHRGALTNTCWERLPPLLPLQKPLTSRPAVDHRCIMHGLCWILRTGALWHPMARRFYRGQKAGAFLQLLAVVPPPVNALDHGNWVLQYVDSTSVRAHQPAAGAKQGHPSRLVGDQDSSRQAMRQYLQRHGSRLPALPANAVSTARGRLIVPCTGCGVRASG
jgi:transposase